MLRQGILYAGTFGNVNIYMTMYQLFVGFLS